MNKQIKEHLYFNLAIIILILFLSIWAIYDLALGKAIGQKEAYDSIIQITPKVAIEECLPLEETIEKEIRRQAREYGVDEETAFRIAYCESGLNPLAQNENSTAKGIYQFLDRTWEENCEGFVFNYEDNIACFMKLYPAHKDWWVCK